jgi:hypothetical protein
MPPKFAPPAICADAVGTNATARDPTTIMLRNWLLLIKALAENRKKISLAHRLNVQSIYLAHSMQALKTPYYPKVGHF